MMKMKKFKEVIMKTIITKKILSVFTAFMLVLSLTATYMPMTAFAAIDITEVNAEANSSGVVTLTFKDDEVNPDITSITVSGTGFEDLPEITTNITSLLETPNKKYTVELTGLTRKIGATDNSLNITFSNGTDTPSSMPVTITGDTTNIPTTTPPTSGTAGTSAYITNYAVTNASGGALTTVNPGDKVNVSFTIIDERVDGVAFGGIAGAFTNRVHATMDQSGAFSSSNLVEVKMKDNVTLSSGFQALSYTLTFRDVVYKGGANTFAFDVGYTGGTGNETDNGSFGPKLTSLSASILQAVDSVPAPKIILNSASYGGTAIVGKAFTLSTVATNVSSNLSIENVSVKITLPQGLVLSSGNSQVIIGTVAPNGTINHNYSLIVQGVQNDIKSLPVTLTYEYEAFVNGVRTAFTSEQALSINISQETRFETSSLDYMPEAFMTDYGYLSASLVNKGKTTVYNVQADIKSEGLMGQQTVFVGNVAPGSTAFADFEFSYMMPGDVYATLVITYEDELGVLSTIEEEISMIVMEDTYFPPEGGMDGMDGMTGIPVEEEPSNMPLIIGAVVVLALAGGGFVFYKKKKAKRLLELEDENEDI